MWMFAIRVTGTGVTWLNETMAWVLIQQTDVTEIIRKQQTEMQERLNTEKMLRQEADKANRAKSDFLSSVSHGRKSDRGS